MEIIAHWLVMFATDLVCKAQTTPINTVTVLNIFKMEPPATLWISYHLQRKVTKSGGAN